ncbi:MAG: 3'(2'), 5'-bisphosphate nucleotidase [Saprospiraceae bacterium]|jgi:3'(2'), 5'-bisphosphate nucleotidase
MNLTKIIEQVCSISIDAGKEILKVYEIMDDIGVEYKADNSPLTKADQAANKKICEGLEALDPAFPIISEENKLVSYAERSQYDYYWLVDPLDGTKEFIKRNGEFTVNIALIKGQMPVAGVVYVPVTQELFWAIKDQGAFYSKDGVEQKLSCEPFSKDKKGLGIVCSRSHLNESTQSFIDQFEEPKLVSKGSSLKFTIIAKGDAHIYPRLAPTMEWDTGAAQIVLEEAGGKVLDANTGQALRYNKENLLNPHFIAYGKVEVKGQ